MENNNLVSIITPMYNANRYIGKTIESVKAQTYENWEMLIVDDCSTDNSVDIVNLYAENDSRIKIFHNSKNSGIAITRNRAIVEAKGRFIAFLDSDDLWKPEKLEKQILFMVENDVSFSYTACDVIDENGKLTGQVRYVPEKVDYKKILRGNDIACLTAVIDRSKVSEIAMPETKHEDYLAWVKILKSGIVAHGVNEILASYRVAKKSVSGSKLKAATWQWKIYRNELRFSVMKSVYCFCCYAFNGVRKRMNILGKNYE